jgi:C-terminal processing protease CtpA/Prc
VPGDRILAIDGRQVAVLSEDEVRSLIVGPPGSEVELLVGQSNTGSFLGGLSESHHKVVLTRRLIDFNDISPSPSSVFSQSPGLSPQSSFTASQPQQFAGVGVLLSQDFTSDLCEVKSLNPVGAAALSGRVKIGDRLLKIDGQSLLGQSLIDVSRRIQVRVSLQAQRAQNLVHSLTELVLETSHIFSGQQDLRFDWCCSGPQIFHLEECGTWRRRWS